MIPKKWERFAKTDPTPGTKVKILPIAMKEKKNPVWMRDRRQFFLIKGFSYLYKTTGYQLKNRGSKAIWDSPTSVFRCAQKAFECSMNCLVLIMMLFGEAGIRTRGTDFSIRQFSKLLLSATQALLHIRRG